VLIFAGAPNRSAPAIPGTSVLIFPRIYLDREGD